ncbi:MAG: hypothetical protein QM598_05785 [Protaetiibacter sp.]
MKTLTRLAVAAEFAIRQKIDSIRDDERGLDKIPITAYFIVATVIIGVIIVAAVTAFTNGELAKIPSGN